MDANHDPCRPAEPSDADLLRRCAAAEPEAIGFLFERHGGALAQYLYRILGSREDAEEAVVDVFVRAWRAAAGFRADASVRNWLYRIALHLAIDRLRVRRRAQDVPLSFSGLDAEIVASLTGEPETAFLDAYQRARDRRALFSALGQLAPQDRALLILHYLEGCSYEQIRDVTGLSLARVKSRLHRARQRLKRHFVAYRNSDEALETLAGGTEDAAWERGQIPVF